jgi:hypothetical protein
MSAVRRARPAPAALELVLAACDVCRSPRAKCASINGGAAVVCFLCALSSAQLIAHSERASKRPHAKTCHCDACVTFDEGQRGEIANLVLLEGGRAAESAATAVQPGHGGDSDAPPPEASDDEPPRVVSRWSVMEVD